MIRPTTIRPVLNQGLAALQKRPISSIRSNLRTAARAMELSPFERLPTTQKSQPGDWGKLVRSVGIRAALFFPGIGLILGWPLLAKMAFDESGGYEIPDHLRLGYGWDS